MRPAAVKLKQRMGKGNLLNLRVKHPDSKPGKGMQNLVANPCRGGGNQPNRPAPAGKQLRQATASGQGLRHAGGQLRRGRWVTLCLS